MKKLIYLFTIAILAHLLLTEPWRTNGICGQGEQVNFRGISFEFPIKVRDALKTPMHGFSRSLRFMQTDSIGGKNISGKWYFGFDSKWDGKELTLNTVKDNLIYGVAFELRDDSCKTDQEIVGEIHNMYPGNYRYFEKYGNPCYIWERDCLTIFVKRAYLYSEGYSVPEVSFCYGLTTSQIDKYGESTGYIEGLPD